jgi:hypothetical protein
MPNDVVWPVRLSGDIGHMHWGDVDHHHGERLSGGDSVVHHERGDYDNVSRRRDVPLAATIKRAASFQHRSDAPFLVPMRLKPLARL